jgi:hypothetical protein
MHQIVAPTKNRLQIRFSLITLLLYFLGISAKGSHPASRAVRAPPQPPAAVSQSDDPESMLIG